GSRTSRLVKDGTGRVVASASFSRTISFIYPSIEAFIIHIYPFVKDKIAKFPHILKKQGKQART
ncbi:MAG: hypothetical protein DSY91_01920, partial [Deltaproteobacteria bacterium]